MTNKDLPTLRQLAANNSRIKYTEHGHSQMVARGYTTNDVEKILTSTANQLVETQSPCLVPGPRFHRDERYIISDPTYSPDTAVLIAINMLNPASPEIVVLTVEPALDTIWDKDSTKNPWLTRIGTMA